MSEAERVLLGSSKLADGSKTVPNGAAGLYLLAHAQDQLGK